jgi:uncharacterized membrane protein YfcA
LPALPAAGSLFPGPSVFGVNAYLLVLLGFVVGILGGFFGVGGTWIVTPGLNLLGLPVVWAVGTDLLHTTGKGIVAAFRHHRLGNVDVRMAAIMVIGSTAGIEIGGSALLYLDKIGAATDVVQIIYILILAGIGTYTLLDYRRIAVTHAPEERRTPLAARLQALRIPPYMRFPASGIERVSVWVPIMIAFFSGIASGLLGVGAGFIRMPSLVYMVGLPTKVAVGTDLFEVIFSAGYGSFFYALSGDALVAVAAVMLLGASLGAQLGAFATDYVKGLRIRLYFGLSVFGPALALIVKQAGKRVGWAPAGVVSVWLLVASGVFIAFFILRSFLLGFLERRYWAQLDAQAGTALASLADEADRRREHVREATGTVPPKEPESSEGRWSP